MLNQIPSTIQLLHISWLDDPHVLMNALHTSNSAAQPCRLVLFGGWIPPIPPKLHKKITEGHYVDMVELCPEHLKTLNVAKEKYSKSSRSKLKYISSILDKVQAFSIYVAVLSKDQPIMLLVSWSTSTYLSTATLTSSSSIGHHMTISFVKRPLYVLN